VATPVHGGGGAGQDAHAGASSGWEMRKKESITSTWIARLLVLGCWCYKDVLAAGALVKN
jgi:hypothetical protein